MVMSPAPVLMGMPAITGGMTRFAAPEPTCGDAMTVNRDRSSERTLAEKRHIHYARRYQLRHKLQHLCHICPTPAAIKLIVQEGRVVYRKRLAYCATHLSAMRARATHAQ